MIYQTTIVGVIFRPPFLKMKTKKKKKSKSITIKKQISEFKRKDFRRRKLNRSAIFVPRSGGATES
jgi:hypothetical protein